MSGIKNKHRYFAFSGGFLVQKPMRQMLCAAGITPQVGLPNGSDFILTWGQRTTARRAKAIAQLTGARQVYLEDAFLRGLHPNDRHSLGFFLDYQGQHFDPNKPSDLEDILAKHPLDDRDLLLRASAAIARIKNLHLSKYSAIDTDIALPPEGFVLVIDQVPNDASLIASNAGADLFAKMLAKARGDHPDHPIVIKSHPAAQKGHFAKEDADYFITEQVSPWALFDRAVAVYTVSSQMGFEAIIAGHRPHVFGGPFYSGWGQSIDYVDLPRRTRHLSHIQIFAAAMILAPKWYDPYCKKITSLETVISILEAQSCAWREDRHGWIGVNMKLWKRRSLQRFFAGGQPFRFAKNLTQARALAQKTGSKIMHWGAAKSAAPDIYMIEDGFLRSNGLGAALVPPMSLVLDQQGIYFDPKQKSDLETYIEASPQLPAEALERAKKLRAQIVAMNVTKYNIDQNAGRAHNSFDFPKNRTLILVPGQVMDDASILRGGCGHDNLSLLRAARAANPDAYIIYKPHPDVEAGLRLGHLPSDTIYQYADFIAQRIDANTLINCADAVWTISSTLGFEALLRGKPVTCLGMPFYAGWGLTNDHAPKLARRKTGVNLLGLIHAVLIDYPRYYDPVTGLACPPEVAVERLASGAAANRGIGLRLLAKAQGVWASMPLWHKLR